MMQTAVFLSIILSFASSELLGIFNGGLISSGYLALYLQQPLRLMSTFVSAVIVWGLIKLMSRWMIIFGRRRYMLTILLSLIIAWVYAELAPALSFAHEDLRIIGFIIPGLIANDMLRQGVLRTLAAVLISSAIIRLILMLGHVI